MNQHDLYRAIGDLDEDLLARSEAPASRRRRPPALKWGALAACLVLVVGLTGFGFAAEAKEYGEAVAFFEGNGLSLEGLSRTDVKKVYRDITTQRFTYERTAEVIEQVPGIEIPQEEPTPEDLAALWKQNMSVPHQPAGHAVYSVDSVEKMDEELGFPVFDHSILHCIRDGTEVWATGFSSFYVDSQQETADGLAVWGWTPTWSSEQPSYGYVARLDSNGSMLWEHRLDHGFQDESVAAVVDNGDGTWAVISRGDFRFLCLSQYDLDGNERSFRKTEVGNLGIWNAVRLGDGYLVQLGNSIYGDHARIARLDRDGNLVDDYSYQAEDCFYHITAMAEFGGRVYLSAYAVPKQEDEGGRDEIGSILRTLMERDSWEISSEELTPMVRSNYTAVLLLCDPEGGAPEAFYTVKGSLGGPLETTEDTLLWDVESVTSTVFSPYTSSYSIGGTCQVFRYSFGPDGTLIGQEDTGQTTDFRR